MCSLWIEAQKSDSNQNSIPPWVYILTSMSIYLLVARAFVCPLCLNGYWWPGCLYGYQGPFPWLLWLMCRCGSFGASCVYMGIGWDGVHTLNRYCWPGLLLGCQQIYCMLGVWASAAIMSTISAQHIGPWGSKADWLMVGTDYGWDWLWEKWNSSECSRPLKQRYLCGIGIYY